MFRRTAFLALAPLTLVTAAPEAAPDKALKYHEALLKRPHNAALFDRFFGAWIDEQPVEALGTFLTARAEANGGQEWTVLALYQLRRGQEDNALVSLGKAMAAEPGDVALAMDRAKLRLRRMEFEAARKDLAVAIAGKDEALALEAAKLTGKSWLREGKTAEAIKAWDAVLAAHPGDEDLLEDLVETAAVEGEINQALAYSEKLIAASKDPYQKTLRSLRRGDLFNQAGRTDDALAAYAATLEQVGEGSWLEREVLAQIDKVFRKQDRLEDLAAQLKKLAEANPRRLLIHRQLAKLEAAQGEADAAIGRFREVLKRSPGDRELREEFVRLLTDGERYDDAATELEKLIATAPAENGLYLQLANIRSRQNKPDAVLAALKKAHELLGKDEGSGIRIAGLMLQYNLNAEGEALLNQLATAAGSGPAPSETLAAHYGRTNRKAEALELLKKVAASEDADVVIRAAGSISALGESAAAFEMLSARAEKFSSEPRFLAAFAQTALAAGKPAEGVVQVVKLVRLAKQTTELAESIGLASRVITGADKVADWRKTLEGQATRTPGETCLLANLADMQGDTDAVSKLLAPATDPLIVHFHAALLDRRGDFDEAIAVLTRLADTDEGRKAAYFKDLSELQQRAGKLNEAIATVERWKQSAPGDKAAWITGSRLLRESGKPEDAVKMTRQAVARFEGDADLAASLASLHDESGQYAEAEAIYWRLYDEAQAPGDQTRWASQLAQLAVKTGKTEELGEKLRERAKGNRRSIGPILAQAELARLTQDEDKRRDLLLEAVRLQPKDVDLRLQIANLEEQSGNGERVIALLEEALPADTGNRVRGALAQAYIRQGQTLKGMREMRAMSGKKVSDFRATEQSAAMLASAKMYDEAIQFMRDEIPGEGDWRSRYMLALLLEEDGREAEALPMFIALLQAQGEIKPQTPVPAANSPAAYYRARYNNFSKEARELMGMMTSAQTAYVHRNQNRGGYSYSMGASSMTGAFSLPDEVEEVRRLSIIHLLKLAKREGAEANKESVLAQIRAAGVANADFLTDLLENVGTNNGDPSKLLEKYPNQPGLYEMVAMYGRQVTVEIAKKVLEHPDKLSPMSRFNARMRVAMGAKPGDAAWTELLTEAKSATEDKDENVRQMVGYQLLSMFSVTAESIATTGRGEMAPIPDARREEFKKLLIETMVTKVEAKEDNLPMRLAALSVAGTTDQWIAALNAGLKESRKKPQNNQPNMMMQGRTAYSRVMQYSRMGGFGGGYNPWDAQSPFELPKLETAPLHSIPALFLYQFKLEESEGYNPYSGGVEVAVAMKNLDRFESPLLRAWIALRAGDNAAAAKVLATEPPKEEAGDFEVLRAIVALENKKPMEAFTLLEKARAQNAADRDFSIWAAISMVSVAEGLTAEERTKIATTLEPLLMQCRQAFGPQAANVVATQATKLGLTDLAKRLQPPAQQVAGASKVNRGPASFGPITGSSSSSSSSSGGNATVEKMVKFASEKKYESAAREALQLIRNARSNSWGYRENGEIVKKLGPEGTAELLKMVDPGESKSLVKRLEYVDIVSMLGKKDIALKTLQQLHEERPEDITISCRLAFALPQEKQAERIKLMEKSAISDDFVTTACQIAEGFDNGATGKDGKDILDFYDLVAAWMESTPAASLEKANLTWVSYYGKNFYRGVSSANLSGLLRDYDSGSRNANKELKERYISIAKRLAIAMVKQPAIAEEGFRLISGSTAWTLPPEEMDGYARQALGSLKLGRDDRYGSSSFFTLRMSNGSSSSGEDLAAHSSVGWLAERLNKVKSPDEILPKPYLEELNKKDPKLGDLVGALASLKTVDQLRKLWEKDVFTSGGSAAAQMIRQSVLARAASVPGASGFFVECLNKLKPATTPGRRGYGMDEGDQLLLQATLTAAANATKDEDVETMCRAIGKALFGEKIEWDKPADAQVLYSKINVMDNLLRQQTLEPVAMVRLLRALYRLQIPTGTSDYYLMRTFQNKKFKTAEEVEKFFESLGWLTDAQDWTPCAAWIVSAESNGNTMNLSVQSKLLSERVLQYMSIPGSTSDFVKRLKDRKTGRFGALMMAAGYSSQPERGILAAQAFSEAGPALAKLPAARVEQFVPVLAWLPRDAVNKLPPGFREKFKGTDEKRRKEVVRQADEFLAKKPTNSNRSYRAGFDLPEGILEQLFALDFDKGVEVFLECERRFTELITQGAQISNSTYDDFQIIQRDERLRAYMRDSDSPLSVDMSLALKFLAKVQASPGGGRFSYSPRYAGEQEGILSEIGQKLRNQARNGKSSDTVEDLKNGLIYSQSLDEAVRNDALIAVACGVLADYSGGSTGQAAKARKSVEPARERLKEQFRYIDLTFGVLWWKFDDEAGHDLTVKALESVLKDPSIRVDSKQCLAFDSVIHVPELLDRPEVSDVLAGLYESYCATERSAVNGWSARLVNVLSRANPGDAGKAAIKRIHEAFWKNSQASKAGGHVNIPPKMASPLMMVALRAGDAAAVKRLAAQTKGTMNGSLSTITALVSAGEYELAKGLLPGARVLYPAVGTTNVFTPDLAKNLKPFVASLSDPEQALRFEAQMLVVKEPTGPGAPPNTAPDRAMALVETYRKNPPKERMIQMEVLALISKNNQLAAIKLAPELAAWAKEFDYKSSISKWDSTPDAKLWGSTQARVSLIESEVMEGAALANFILGDTSVLEAVTAAIVGAPVVEKTDDGYETKGNTEFVVEYIHTSLLNRAAFWIWMAVGRGETTGFEKSLKSFEELALTTDGRFEFDAANVNPPLAICHFLSNWIGQPERFDALIARMKTRADMAKKLPRKNSLVPMANAASPFGGWKSTYFVELREKALVAAFSRPSIAPMISRDGGWVEQLAAKVPEEELFKVARLPVGTTIPEVRPALLEYVGKRMAVAKKPDESVAAFKQCLAECPPDKEWNDLRGAAKVALAEVLVFQEKKDEARALIEGMPLPEVGSWIKNRYVKITEVLGVKSVVPPPAPKPPAPAPAKPGEPAPGATEKPKEKAPAKP